jgi:hypothetical protein
MKTIYFSLVIAGIIFSSCGDKPAEEKKDSVVVDQLNPTVSFKPRGELITAYEQVYSHSDDRHWVEVYLYVTPDSIIETEVEKLSKESTEPAAIYCFVAAKSQLDYTTLKALDYDAVKEPQGMKKVSIEVKDKNNKVLQWVSDPRMQEGNTLDTLWVTGIRVLTKDEAQANEVMEKLKSGL